MAALTDTPILAVIAALASGGLFAAITRWRPEAESSAVKSAEAMLARADAQLDRADERYREIEEKMGAMRDRIAHLERDVSRLQGELVKAEREAERWKERYMSAAAKLKAITNKRDTP